MSKRIEIVFGKDGSIRSEGFEFEGPECLEKRQFLDEEFGAPKKEELKESYNLSTTKTTITNPIPSGHCG
jgi:hypothetical protein